MLHALTSFLRCLVRADNSFMRYTDTIIHLQRHGNIQVSNNHETTSYSGNKKSFKNEEGHFFILMIAILSSVMQKTIAIIRIFDDILLQVLFGWEEC